MNRNARIALSALATAVALVVAGCGGASDSTDSADSTAGGGKGAAKLSLVAYAVPKVGFDKVIPLFQKTSAGEGVAFSQSYGASATSRARSRRASPPTS